MMWEISELQRLETRQNKAQKKGKKKGAASTGAALALEKRREKIGAYPLSRAGAAELDGTVFALRALGFIGPDDQLPLKGRLLRSIFHPAGALMVEMIMQGLLDEVTVSELAEVCSWFTFNTDKRVKNRNVVHAKLVQVRRQLWHIVQHVNGVEQRASINLTPGIAPEFHGVALAWSRGMSLSGLMNRIDLAEGDMLMSINQTIDLLQQVQAAVGQVLDSRDLWTQTEVLAEEQDTTSARKERERSEQLALQRKRLEHIRPLLAQASASLLHGIIVQSRTVPSMVAMVEGEPVPLDAEEDLDPEILKDPTV